jgi:hypothetical protein
MKSPSLGGSLGNWKTFQYDQIFEIKKGTRLTKADMLEGSTPFIGASDARNGVTAYVNKEPDHPANVLTVAYNGSVAEAFYQPAPFCATDDINVLYPKFKIDEYSGVFIATVIKQERYRFNYGRKWHKERMEQSHIPLPVTNSGEIDTDAMSAYILNLNDHKTVESIVKQSEKVDTVSRLGLETTSWRHFNLTDLFEVSASSDELLDVLEIGGETPYITSSDSNNGITAYVTDEPTNSAGTITANRGGSVGYFFYQPRSYKATPVDVRILTPKFKINPYIGLFLKTVLQMEKYRFNYSRKMGSDRLSKLKIKLPSKNGEPDWSYMERYIKGQPYSSSILN